MGIELASSFTRKAAVPLDDISVVADLTARDAIASGVRYVGMTVYVTSEGANYQLIGGITNSNWEDFGSGGGGGGGAALTFVKGDPSGFFQSPDTLVYNGNAGAFPFKILNWRYLASGKEVIYGYVTVPSTYKAGKVIYLQGMQVFVNSTDTSKKILINAYSFLVKPGESVATFPGSGESSTNTEITVVSNANRLINVGNVNLNKVADGKIDGRAVAAGDKIFFFLARDCGNESASVQEDVAMVCDLNDNPVASINFKG